MRLNKFNWLIFLFCIGAAPLSAQYHGIERSYFRFPIRPEKVNYLSGNMGELRSTHFHAGLDIKTAGREGLKVYAAADGYISRIRTGTIGYGNCLYIQHPNGTTTVYAHLQRFNPVIAQYTLENQYKQKSFEVNLFPEEGAFKVNKGDIIGLSGNSGASTGPHLHFEIRGLNHEILDPLRIGFSQIKDNLPPTPRILALKTMDINARIGGQFGRFEYTLQKNGNTFGLPDTIEVYGKVGLELYAYDRHNGATNRNGVPIIDMLVNGRLHFQQNIDSIQFSQQRSILIHTNYRAQRESRRRFNKLYIDDGNVLDFYKTKKNRGFLYVAPGQIKSIDIHLADAYRNKSTVKLTLVGKLPEIFLKKDIKPKNDGYVLDNTLMLFHKKDSLRNNITLYDQGSSVVIAPTYYNTQTNTYLVDLRKFLPQKVSFPDGTVQLLYFADRIFPAHSQTLAGDTYSLRFPKSSLFDTVYIRTRHFIDSSKTDIFEVGNNLYPLKDSIHAEFYPIGRYDTLAQYHVYDMDDPAKPEFIGGTYKEGKFHFSFSHLGRFKLLRDDKAPQISRKRIKNEIIRFSVKDNLSGIHTFEAELNGEWLLMHYEPKRNLIWSERLDKNKPLKGTFKLKVADNAGNKSSITLKLD